MDNQSEPLKRSGEGRDLSGFPLNTDFLAALGVAYEWHLGQYRKVAKGETETTPYLAHLLGVASIALEFGATQEEAIGALLHDALEDGPDYMAHDAETLQAEIKRLFGSKVEHIVTAATDAMPKPGEKKKPWPERKSEYLQKLKDKTDDSALLVTASDKLYNARAILSDVLAAGEGAEAREGFFKRFNQGEEGTLQYYRLLVDAYRMAPGTQKRPRLQALVNELDRTVTLLEQTCGRTADEVRDHHLLRGALSGQQPGKEKGATEMSEV